MIQINLVARVASDKNNFFDLVFIASELKKSGYTDFNFLFIGDIESTSIYQSILHLAGLLNVSEHIHLTKRSIPLAELSEEIKDGYFLNYSVGKFIGYSGIDSIAMGFKTIFVNGDKALETEDMASANICRNIPEFIEFIKLLMTDTVAISNEIKASNIKMSEAFQLNKVDAALLLGTMK